MKYDEKFERELREHKEKTDAMLRASIASSKGIRPDEVSPYEMEVVLVDTLLAKDRFDREKRRKEVKEKSVVGHETFPTTEVVSSRRDTTVPRENRFSLLRELFNDFM